MKHLSIRPSAQTHIVPTLAGALVQFTAKKINQVVTMPQRVKGQWRLYLNYCPECNSCAPKTKCCDVCNSDTRAFFHWTEDIRESWWKKYAEKHRIAI